MWKSIAESSAAQAASASRLAPLDANDGRDHREFELAVAVAEKGLDDFPIETAGDLFGSGDGKLVASVAQLTKFL